LHWTVIAGCWPLYGLCSLPSRQSCEGDIWSWLSCNTCYSVIIKLDTKGGHGAK